jgi:hypothetical protein
MVKRQLRVEVTVSDQGSYNKLDAPSLPRISWQVTDEYVALVKFSMSEENQKHSSKTFSIFVLSTLSPTQIALGMN